MASKQYKLPFMCSKDLCKILVHAPTQTKSTSRISTPSSSSCSSLPAAVQMDIRFRSASSTKMRRMRITRLSSRRFMDSTLVFAQPRSSGRRCTTTRTPSIKIFSNRCSSVWVSCASEFEVNSQRDRFDDHWMRVSGSAIGVMFSTTLFPHQFVTILVLAWFALTAVCAMDCMAKLAMSASRESSSVASKSSLSNSMSCSSTMALSLMLASDTSTTVSSISLITWSIAASAASMDNICG
mmetsp:Transcript_44431/g.121081  ORF Transcript_44431/g.121081 Transcript_44431/m.121081 type:complete len:239 (+) Transcript_44431:684-1400(+)